MSWADMPNRNDGVTRRAGAAEAGDDRFSAEFVDLRHRARHLIAEIVRLSRQLADLQKVIRSRHDSTGGTRRLPRREFGGASPAGDGMPRMRFTEQGDGRD